MRHRNRRLRASLRAVVPAVAAAIWLAAAPADAQSGAAPQDRLHLVLERCDAGQAAPDECRAASETLLRLYGTEDNLREAHGVFLMARAMPRPEKPAAKAVARKTGQ